MDVVGARVVRLDDAADPRLVEYTDLRDVQLRTSLEAEHGLFIAEGEKVIRRAVEAGYRVRSFLLSERWLDDLADLVAQADAPCYVMPAEAIERLTGFHVHRGALASMARRPLPSVAEVLEQARSAPAMTPDVDSARARDAHGRPHRSRIAIFEDLVDHTNLGAGFRSAAALGVGAVLVTARCADPLYRRAIKVSMGTVFQVPWTRIELWPEGIDLLRHEGYVVVGMTLGEGTITLDELVAEDHPRLAFVFGTEGHGLSPATDRRLDRRVTIPMRAGVDSLNVAAASAVAFYATR